MLIQGRKITEERVAELQDEIREFIKEAEGISQRVIPEESPECKSLWEDYVKGWVVPEEKNDVCIMFRDRHCTLIIFGESLPDNMKRNSALHNHEFFLMRAMRDIASDLEISLEEFYNSGTYMADVEYSGIRYFC